MSKTTKIINKITTLLQSVSGLYLDDDPNLNKLYKDVKKFIKKAKKEQKFIMLIDWHIESKGEQE